MGGGGGRVVATGEGWPLTALPVASVCTAVLLADVRAGIVAVVPPVLVVDIVLPRFGPVVVLLPGAA